MLPVDEDRVLADLRTLAEFGKQGTGVSRPAFSDADLKARRWLADQMQAAGLETVIDGIGTVYGRSPDAEQSVLVGEIEGQVIELDLEGVGNPGGDGEEKRRPVGAILLTRKLGVRDGRDDHGRA